MSAYNYTAFDRIGKKHGGLVSAASEREARKLIKDLNLIPIDVNKTAKANVAARYCLWGSVVEKISFRIRQTIREKPIKPITPASINHST